MKTVYVKRYQMHKSDRWGIQQMPCYTNPLRATVRNGNHLPVIWEWACNGRQLSEGEVSDLLRRYPICEFLGDDELALRSKR